MLPPDTGHMFGSLENISGEKNHPTGAGKVVCLLAISLFPLRSMVLEGTNQGMF